MLTVLRPIIKRISYTYKKVIGGDVRILNVGSLPIPKKLVKDIQLVYLGPKSVGGNHKHIRTEWYVALGELNLIWLDEQGKKHTEKMFQKDKLTLIKIPSFLPHAVVNPSKTKTSIIWEIADRKQKIVEVVKVV